MEAGGLATAWLATPNTEPEATRTQSHRNAEEGEQQGPIRIVQWLQRRARRWIQRPASARGVSMNVRAKAAPALAALQDGMQTMDVDSGTLLA